MPSSGSPDSWCWRRTPSVRPTSQARAAEDVVRVSSAEAAAYIDRSAFLARSHGFFPRNWRFYPYALGPEQPLAQMTHLLGAAARRPIGGAGVHRRG